MSRRVKATLSRFYVRQGLTGKHLRAALRHDLRSLRKQGAITDHGKQIPTGGGLASCGKKWSELSEGGFYWARRAIHGTPRTW